MLRREGAWGNWLVWCAACNSMELTPPVQIEQRVWFNGELKSRNFLALVAIIMTLIDALHTTG